MDKGVRVEKRVILVLQANKAQLANAVKEVIPAPLDKKDQPDLQEKVAALVL